MHIAETKEKAMADVRFGLEKWLYYFREVANLPIVPDTAMATRSRPSCRCRWRCVGTPDDAAAKIQALVDQSGGFGCFLFMAHNWAPLGARPSAPTSSSPATWRRSSSA